MKTTSVHRRVLCMVAMLFAAKTAGFVHDFRRRSPHYRTAVASDIEMIGRGKGRHTHIYGRRSRDEKKRTENRKRITILRLSQSPDVFWRKTEKLGANSVIVIIVQFDDERDRDTERTHRNTHRTREATGRMLGRWGPSNARHTRTDVAGRRGRRWSRFCRRLPPSRRASVPWRSLSVGWRGVGARLLPVREKQLTDRRRRRDKATASADHDREPRFPLL